MRDQRLPYPRHPVTRVSERTLGLERQLAQMANGGRVIAPIASTVTATPAAGMIRGRSDGTVWYYDGTDWRQVMLPPAVLPVLATGAAHTVDDVITFLQGVGLCKQS